MDVAPDVIAEDPPRLTLAALIERRAAMDPHGAVLTSTARVWTAGDLAAVTADVAARVAAAAARDGERPVLAVEAPTPSLLGVAVVASAAVGAAAPVPLDLPADRRAALLARLRPVLTIDGRDLHGDVVGPLASPHRAPELDDAAIILSTSGSTDEPKLVPNTHRNLWSSARFAARAQRLGPGDRCLALGSMGHVLGLRAFTDALWCGAEVIVPDELTVGELAEQLRRHHPTCVVAPPPLLHTLAAAVESLSAEERASVAACLRYIRSGAAALRSGLIERLQTDLDAAVLHGYGMTEVAKIACTPLDGSAPPDSVGRPLGVELRIDRAAAAELGDDVGEVVVRGDVVAPGYFDDGHESASAFEDGWFRTGDLGRLDADGNLFLLGRRDDVVSRGGVLVSLVSLEHALEAHPGVALALAAPIEHPNLGIDVVLAYVRADGAPSIEAGALRDFLQTQLPATQAPTRIIEVDRLPLTSSGKPSRAGLAELLELDRPTPAPLSSVEKDPMVDGVELRLAALWCSLLLLDEPVSSDDNIFALGADSLHLVELCTMVADTFGVEVLPGELVGSASLEAMASLVREGAVRRGRPILVPLRSGGSDRLPLYVVPGSGGTLAAVHRFVFNLQPGRRVLGFEAPGLYRDEEAPASASALAERYVDELIADVGDGPFVLVGTSFGSVVVQEMTRQLELGGRAPELVVMFDFPPPGVEMKPRASTRVASKVQRTLKRTKPVRVALKAVRRVRPREVPVDRMLTAIDRQVLSSRAVRRSHRAGPISTPTLLFTSRDTRRRTGHALVGWQPFLLGPVETVRFPGTHLELIRERGPATGAALEKRLVELDRTAAR